MFEGLSVRMQLLLVSGLLLILFLAVRFNAKNNRKKRTKHKNRDFGSGLREKMKQRENRDE